VFRDRFIAVVVAVLVFGATQGAASAAPADSPALTVFAGAATAGSSGDGGPASGALLDHPGGVAVGPDGTVYISDTGNHRVRAVSADGTISTVAGSGRLGTPGAEVPDGATGTEVDLALPQSLAVGPDRTVYIADAGLFRVFALSPAGRLSVLAGRGAKGFAGDGGPATNAAIGSPSGLAAAPDRTVYIADAANQRVRAVSPAGVIATVAGNGGTQVTAAGGAATKIPVPAATSLADDGHGTLWIADGLLVHRVSGGQLATVTVPAAGTWGTSEAATWPPADSAMNNVAAVAAGGDGVYALDGQACALLRLGAGQVLKTVTKLDNCLTGPIAVAASGAPYLVDNTNNRVYTIRQAGSGAGASDKGTSTPWWPFAAAGVVVVLFGGWLILRRGRRTR
jgi:hypothetical protein